MKPAYRMTLKNHAIYELAEDGAVLSRSDGPEGWVYSGEWIILGFAKRHMSKRIIPLNRAANGADVGQGWVHDWDHGTHRLWGHPTGRRLASIVAL